MPGNSVENNHRMSRAHRTNYVCFWQAVERRSNTTQDALAGSPLGAFAGATAAGLTHVLRENGIQKADDLIKDALLNPQRARYLMLKVKPEGEKAIVQTVAQMFRRAAVQSLAQTSDQEKSPVEVEVRGGAR